MSKSRNTVFDPQAQLPVWVKAVPFFMSSLFFLSALFTVFAPMPLVFLFARSGWRWFSAAVVANIIIVSSLGGATSAAFFSCFVVTTAVGISYFLVDRKFSIEKTIGTTFLAILLGATALVVAYSSAIGKSPVELFNQEISTVIAQLKKGSLTTGSDPDGWIAGMPESAFKKRVMVEFPSAVAIFTLVMVWINTVVLIRANPRGLRKKLNIKMEYFRTWKAPDWLVWPTIVSGGSVIMDLGTISDFGINFFKVCMAVYALQGLSILNYFFDHWKIKGLLRSGIIVMVVFLMMPLLLAIGFFDLWFDFRAKLKRE